ncbi:MAG: ABC transporter ATP-binding protein/permease [Methylobacteriaceae bacterium]|nr:ABC transporter ATP-binding protein/permease [Methylobacteriaceae bacterium]
MEPQLFRYIWRHSRREQIIILLIIVASLPFYWISLDVPKAIVNDAIQGRAFTHGKTVARLFEGVISLPDFLGGTKILEIPGIPLGQMQYLFALSGWYFVLVLVNGWFKYLVNIRKGILGEWMLRRMRFDLFALLMRFRPEDIRAVKPAEVASMIKDEVEPIGAFIGDAFIQPAFLGTQALTALGFIMLQNFWMGLVALLIVLVQAVVIPHLRKEQIRLGRLRQLASRQLAGRIGEIVDGAEAVHVHGTAAYSEADIDRRLRGLYKIRVDLFRRKFSVKYLNNLLAQLTPFFFYAIGGYFALNKGLDIGQLVAVIAAYRDLPSPIKELIDWDQQRNDVTVKYEQIVTQFSPEHLLPPSEVDAPALPPPVDAPISVKGLYVAGGRGNVLLERTSVVMERPAHIALVGSTGSGRDILAKVLGRQITEFMGSVDIGGQAITHISDETASRFLAYVGPEAQLFPGSIRDNVVYSLLRRVPPGGSQSDLAEWIDYPAAGANGPADLDRVVLGALEIGGAGEDIYRFGILGRLGRNSDPAIAERFVEARHVVRERLEAHDLTDLVEPFDPGHYNSNATIGENLLFGVPLGEALSLSRLPFDPYTRSIIEAEALVERLTEIGIKIAQATLETFADLPPGHPLFARYSFIGAEDLDVFRRILDTAHMPGGGWRLSEEQRARLIGLAYSYVEPRHRLDLIDPPLQTRILRARASFKRFLPINYADSIEFYDPGHFLTAAPILDNLLFGRVDYGVGNADQKVSAVVREALVDLNLLAAVYNLGLEYEVGVGGRLLFPSMRVAIDLARSLIKRPDIFIIDGLIGGSPETKPILDGIRSQTSGRTLIVTLPEGTETEDFDQVISFDGPQLRADVRQSGPGAAMAGEMVAHPAA